MDGHKPGEIKTTLAESQHIGLAIKSIQALLNEGKEASEIIESGGRLYRVEGKLLPTPHIEITPIDN